MAVWRCVSSLALALCVAWPLGAQQPRQVLPGTWDTVNKIDAQVKQMRAAGQTQAALALCEQFLVDNPNAEWMTGTVVDKAMACMVELAPTQADREKWCERILKLYPNVPWYHAAATFHLATGYLFAGNGFKQDFAKCVEVTQGKFEQYLGKLPIGLYLLHAPAFYEARALSKLGRNDEAKARIALLVTKVPAVLRNGEALSAWVDILVAAGEAEAARGVAKLGYMCCDYETESLRRAIERCSGALRMGGVPGPAVLFTRCQEDMTLTNPLAKVPLPELPPADEWLKAAGSDTQAQFLVHVATGHIDTAVAMGRKQLAEWVGGDDKRLERVMRNLAICFKAHDLSLKRANAFLEYNRTGEGEDPLPALEADLKAAKEAPK